MRVKMGVGAKPAGWDLADYVLGHFSGEERKHMDEAAQKAVEAIRMMVNDEADSAMNRYNTKKEA
jgi:PTH1 family peptidyl-tRNA hydrolase